MFEYAIRLNLPFDDIPFAQEAGARYSAIHATSQRAPLKQHRKDFHSSNIAKISTQATSQIFPLKQQFANENPNCSQFLIYA